MKKLSWFLLLIIGLIMPVFAQGKHQQFDMYFGLSLGAAGMKTNDNGIFTADFGVNYGFYFFNRVSINTGILFHTELYSNHNMLTGTDPMQTPLCFTIPIGFHFNIPKAEWLYTGVSFAVNIPIADFRSSSASVNRHGEVSGGKSPFTADSVFFSLPIDIGIDMIKPGRGGSRLLFRVTPAFYKGGTIVPLGIIWQIYNWRVHQKTVNVEVNVPPPPEPPVINIPGS